MTTETSEESTIHITYVEGDALYHKYPSQQSRQDCYVSLDCETGNLSADWDGIIGAGIPMNVYHSRTLRWRIPALTEGAANGLLGDILPYAEKILAGYESVWDGHNRVGNLTEDASEAREAIQSLCDRDWESQSIEAWDACDWFGGIGGNDYQRRALKITADTTDLQLIKIAGDEETDAAPRVINGALRYLTALRDEAFENAEPDED